MLLPSKKDGNFPFALTEETPPSVETDTYPCRQGEDVASYQRMRRYIDDIKTHEDVIDTYVGDVQENGFLRRQHQEEENLGPAEMRHVQQLLNQHM